MWCLNDNGNTLINNKLITYVRCIQTSPQLLIGFINGKDYKFNYNSYEKVAEDYNKLMERG